MEFLNFVRDTFGMNAFEIAVVGLLVLLMVIVAWAAHKFGLVEAVTHREKEIKLLSNFLLDNVMLIAHGSAVDLSPYEDRASERQENGEQYIDPRMLFLMDKADDYISGRVGFNVSFDELYAKAEAVYQMYRATQPVVPKADTQPAE
jgi:hypothetical protein